MIARQSSTRCAGKWGLKDFASLAAKGTSGHLWPEPVLQFADLTFPTPSGKIEILERGR